MPEVYKYIGQHRILHPDGREFVDMPENSIWQALKVRIDAGDPDVVIEPWPYPGPDPAKMWPLVRRERNLRLAECDWIHLPNVTVSDEAKATWESYRQELRDLPTTVADDRPHEVVWPTKPGD